MTRQRAFTYLELLLVIFLIGMLVALLLPAVQACREASRRATCMSHLNQIALALQEYELTHGAFPSGVMDPKRPISNRRQGYHHSWITLILPQLGYPNEERYLDRRVSVYHPANQQISAASIPLLQCPSDAKAAAASNYAAAHHDVEAPIDITNNGVLFLNSRIRCEDLYDGASHTLLVGEKIVDANDLGWTSGTRATLRNTGALINAFQTGGGAVANPINSTNSRARARTALYVGGFGSYHPGGAQFALADGSVRFVAETMSTTALRSLANRADQHLNDPWW